MEFDWQRQKPFYDLSLAEIQEVLVPSGIAVASAIPIQEGLANSNYFVETDEGRRLVFRVCQSEPDSKPLQIAVARRLGRAIPMPNVVEELPESPYLLMEWLPGRTMQARWADGEQEQVLEAAHSIGLALAKIASHRMGTCGFLNPRLTVVEPWGNLYEAFNRYRSDHARYAYLKGRMSFENLMATEGLWQKRKEPLTAVMDQACLSHGDFKASNLLIEDGRLSGVLDWDFVHAGTWLLDAGQVLRYLGDRREDFAERFASGMIEGGMKLPDRWQEMARIVDLMNLVDFLCRPKIGDQQILQITDLIETTIRDLT
ncbi:MAG: aminoglycoside phosphotransferase family protein [Armatimonadetes bacterium]|nr:aminoglycoside phosphotransferase family protein [Armatimonadota bacterium]